MLLKINHHAQHNSGLYGTLREHEWMPRSQPGFLLICGWAGTLGNSFFLEEVVKIESETKKDLAAANSIALQTEVANYSKLY